MSLSLYERKIADGLKTMAEKHGPDIIVSVIVQSPVDTVNFTCTCKDDLGYVYADVLYKTVIGGSADIVFQPAVNSRIFIGRIDSGEDWVMVMPGACDKVFINANTEIVLNGGNNGGLVLRDGIKGQLNKIEQDLNNLKNIFATWVPVPNDGGSALKTIATTWAGSELTETGNTDIENTHIKQ